MAMSTFGAGSIRVCCRARPLLPSEKNSGETCVVSATESKNLLVFPPTFSQAQGAAGARLNTTLSRSFEFDLSCDETFDQTAIFEQCGAKSMVDASLDGVKATILAYGATSSGKTYTMSGLDQSSGGGDAASHVQTSDSHEGLILKSTRYLFEKIKEREKDGCGDFELTASYLEVYNEQVFDLLNMTGRHLGVRHQPVSDEFYVPGLLEVRCETLSDLCAVLEEGHANRRRAGHELNQDSSRSHSLLIVHVVCDMSKLGGMNAHKNKGSTSNSNSASSSSSSMKKHGKLVFVDLAGSERLKRSKSSDAEETGAINKSLFTLAKVISLLADLNERSSTAHVPYRDSVLTKLLSDALGGNALALFLACISPSDARCEETLATLHYANRARSIKNRPTIVVEAGEGTRPETEIAMLRSEVLQLRADKNRLEAENVDLRVQLSHLNNEAGGLGGMGSDLLGLINGAPNSIDMNSNSLKGGRPRGDVANKALLSTDGRGMQGRPPPGAAGRATREAHEKAKGFQNEVRRLEALLSGAQKSESQAKREASALRSQLEQLQNITRPLQQDHTAVGGHGQGGQGGNGSSSAENQLTQQKELAVGQLVSSQREVDRLRGAFIKMKNEKATIVAEYEEFVHEKNELEEKVVLAERSLQQMEHHNTELQQQLRQRDEELAQFNTTMGAMTIEEPSCLYPHLKNSLPST